MCPGVATALPPPRGAWVPAHPQDTWQKWVSGWDPPALMVLTSFHQLFPSRSFNFPANSFLSSQIRFKKNRHQEGEAWAGSQGSFGGAVASTGWVARPFGERTGRRVHHPRSALRENKSVVPISQMRGTPWWTPAAGSGAGQLSRHSIHPPFFHPPNFPVDQIWGLPIATVGDVLTNRPLPPPSRALGTRLQRKEGDGFLDPQQHFPCREPRRRRSEHTPSVVTTRDLRAEESLRIAANHSG